VTVASGTLERLPKSSVPYEAVWETAIALELIREIEAGRGSRGSSATQHVRRGGGRDRPRGILERYRVVLSLMLLIHWLSILVLVIAGRRDALVAPPTEIDPSPKQLRQPPAQNNSGQ
jgi:hypothetical protein